MLRKYLYIALLILLSVPAVAQIVYQCDFEDEAERAQWMLNVGKQGASCINKWYIGAPGNHAPDAEYGLYISTDGNDATYSAEQTMFVVSYRELTIPAGEYDFFFDWRCNGKRSGEEGFYILWVPTDVVTNSNKATADLPNWAKEEDYVLADCFHGASSWDLGHIELSLQEEQTRKLVFVWFSTRGSAALPSACIDNIEIVTKGSCPLPSNFKHKINKDASATIEWSKNGASVFDVRSYDYQTGQWRAESDLRLPRVTLYNLSEGFHDVYVRSHCTNEEGVGQYVKYSFFMFHKGVRCIDYMDLSTQTCRVGTKDVPLGSPQVVDFGYADYDNSLHTLHYVPGERDPYTDGTLLTKPEDAIASVRLGRYAPTFGAACEYKYHVPTGDKAILKIRYAVVLPAPHEPQDNPTFKLEVLANGRALEHNCGLADFVAGAANSGWKSTQYNSETITWKDWTEMAVNLRDYVGQTITVRLMITGCKMSAHGAYAYFTLDCESGEMSGQNCGEDNPTTTFTAPSGFNYAWYLPSKPGTILSRNQTFTIEPMDTATYHVDVISKSNGNCYYTMEACGIPRFPVAEAEATSRVVQCQNEVTFHNTSCVYYKNQVSERTFTRSEGVDHVLWDFGDGTQSALDEEYVSHIYPDTGGVYVATLYAYLNGRDTTCFATKQIRIELADVGLPEREVHLSVGSVYDGKVYWNPYQFDTMYIDNGCEELVHVYIHERYFDQTDSLCQGGAYEVGGKTFTESGTYTVILTNQWGLDSIVTLTLNVEPRVIIELADTFAVCGDQTAVVLPLQVVQGRLDSIHLLFDASASSAGFDSVYAFGADDEVRVDLPENVTPGYYPAILQLGTPRCPVPDVPVVVVVNYPASIIAQKDGIIALLNDKYNGGYEFNGYQWYRNGQLIRGANESYLVVGEEDLGAQYVAVLTRSTDGVTVTACPIVYNGGLAGVEDVTIADDGEWMLLDVMGRVIMQSVTNDRPVVTTPGVYILVRPATRQAVKIVIQ
ncbi:MAG: hypothetical protein IJT12_01350 [Paludibacteraceae bacterium]|nr:hypothetical protein [Paludibacteraceae bacterium]